MSQKQRSKTGAAARDLYTPSFLMQVPRINTVFRKQIQPKWAFPETPTRKSAQLQHGVNILVHKLVPDNDVNTLIATLEKLFKSYLPPVPFKGHWPYFLTGQYNVSYNPGAYGLYLLPDSLDIDNKPADVVTAERTLNSIGYYHIYQSEIANIAVVLEEQFHTVARNLYTYYLSTSSTASPHLNWGANDVMQVLQASYTAAVNNKWYAPDPNWTQLYAIEKFFYVTHAVYYGIPYESYVTGTEVIDGKTIGNLGLKTKNDIETRLPNLASKFKEQPIYTTVPTK